MERRHDLRPLPYRGGDALHGTRADIADRKDTLQTCLHRAAVVAGISTCQYESLGVQRYSRSGEPILVRLRPYEQK